MNINEVYVPVHRYYHIIYCYGGEDSGIIPLAVKNRNIPKLSKLFFALQATTPVK